MERTASRQTAFALTAGLGLAAGVVILVWMVIDHATTNTVLARVNANYGPLGTIPDPMVPWLALYATFGAGAICWALALWGAVKHTKWARPFGIAVFIAGGALLVFLFMVSENGNAILPMGWRIVCLSVAIYGAIAALVAWLPVNGRIKA